MEDDLELLWEYARSGANQAFATVAGRYVDLVYSAALRQVRDPHVAEDVTQAVLILLMNRAGTLPPGTVVPGWLVRATRFAAMDAMKMGRRRARHERRAARERRVADDEATSAGPRWADVAPLVDEALLKLSAEDRDAVVLRYLLGKSPEEIAWVMQVGEEAARKRVSRALGRLRDVLAGMGVRAEEGALGSVLMASAVMRAPASVSSAAASIAAAGSGALGAPPAVIARGASRAMAWSRGRWVVYASGLGGGIAVAAVMVAVWAGRRPMGAEKPAAAPAPVVEVIPKAPLQSVVPVRTGAQIEAQYVGKNKSLSRLSWAVVGGDVEAVKYFVAAGDDVNERSRDGQNQTPLHWACYQARDAGYEVARLLLEHGADVNARRKGDVTALMIAVRQHSLRTVKLLVEHGADVRLASGRGEGAMDWAREGHDVAIVEFLRRVEQVQSVGGAATRP